MKDKLHQINISYSPKEDRLLLRISSQTGDEFRLWLTRRFTALLIGLLNKEMDKRGGMPTVAASNETTQMLKQGALEKKYEEKDAGFPLGKKGVLAYRINVNNKTSGILVLELLPEKGEGVTINLNKSLMYMLHSILSQGISQADWRLPSEVSPSMKVH